MRFARVENHQVVNIEEWASAPANDSDVSYMRSDVAGIGWIYDPVLRVLAPPPAAPATPPSVTRRQARLALLQDGKLDLVEGAVAAAGRAAQIWYEDSDVWQRHNDQLLALAQGGLGWPDSEVDRLFTAAALLP